MSRPGSSASRNGAPEQPANPMENSSMSQLSGVNTAKHTRKKIQTDVRRRLQPRWPSARARPPPTARLPTAPPTDGDAR